ncbi:MAG: lysophospholipid acyltransferase family protein [Desulfobacteraceae bacterium]|nr:lysophospholipid acyltransferase family protein [Pseudomonadota bacterium]MBU4463292.1 lysophospholipid acyltransferase family protein [Pseudomonadota bacterium]MCG2754360.1 lysophospholipid acyltransferase family protein [Desulfobacteraceae bacterium]
MFNLQEIAYKVIAGLLKVLGLIPRKTAFKLGNFIGRILFLADRKHRKIAIDNLTRSFGHEKSSYEIKTLVRRVFKNLSQIIFEIGWSFRLESKDFNKHFFINGLSNFEAAFEKGKGVLFLTAHIGNWELLPVIGAMTGRNINILFRPLDFLILNTIFINTRTRFGAKLIPTRHSMRKILSRLKKDEGVVILLDQNVDWYEGVFVDFFGDRACTNKGLALLALKTEAPVVPVFLVREGLGFKAEFCREAPLIKTGDKTKDVEENTQQYNRIIEDFIRQYPDQWFWLHQRWKTKPFAPWPRKI